MSYHMEGCEVSIGLELHEWFGCGQAGRHGRTWPGRGSQRYHQEGARFAMMMRGMMV
jgi:hypothetical protein